VRHPPLSRTAHSPRGPVAAVAGVGRPARCG
jgi:hypothetical protein